MSKIRFTQEYLAVKKFYGKTKTKRSKVLLINHIDEGLEILEKIGASELAKRAYCLHPFFQGDEELRKNRNLFRKLDPGSVALVMEYRNIANAYLSHRKISSTKEIVLSPLHEVDQMLIADKIQNFKDFMRYHYSHHHKSRELFQYFKNWFKKLKIPSSVFKELQKDSSRLPKLNGF